MRNKEQTTKPQEEKKAAGRRTARKKTSSSHTKWIAVAAVAAVVLLYGAGVYHYKSHFLRNTYINNTKVGGMTVDEAEKTFTQDFASHKIAIKEKERTEIIDPQDVDAVIAVGSQVQDLYDSMNPWTWFMNFFGKKDHTVALDVTYDQEKLKTVVDNLECFAKANVVAPKDAYIKAGETKFEIVPEVLGNTVKKKQLLQLIGTDLATGVTSIHLEKEDLYKLPSYYEKDQVVQDALAAANTYTHGTITYDFKYTTETVDYNTSKDWVNISRDFKVTLSDEKIGDYVEELGNKYNTMGAARDFTTSAGNKINAYGGDYG